MDHLALQRLQPGQDPRVPPRPPPRWLPRGMFCAGPRMPKPREPWACGDCDCTKKLEQRLNETGVPFLEGVKKAIDG